MAHQKNNKMRTAMQDLIFEFYSKSTDDFQFWIRDNIEHLLKKEKEQIIDAHINGQSDHHFSLESRTTEAEEYYNKIINQNK